MWVAGTAAIAHAMKRWSETEKVDSDHRGHDTWEREHSRVRLFRVQIDGLGSCENMNLLIGVYICTTIAVLVVHCTWSSKSRKGVKLYCS